MLNLILFFISLSTTIIAGALQKGINPLQEPYRMYEGLPFSITLMLILGAHELGHFIASTRNGVKATLPYFIPAPSIIGTFGAFIKIKTPIPNKNVLLKIGATGPITGFLIALPALIIGLMLSEVKANIILTGNISLGSSIILIFFTKLILGISVFNNDVNILLHPIAFAAWIGMFITALNLLPIGQLDGGHITYSLFGEKKHEKISKILFFLLIPLGYFWPGWFFWAILVFFLGFKHPKVNDNLIPLNSKERNIGYSTIVIFFLTFTPVPFS